MSGNDKPPKAAYTEWAALNNVSVPWESLNTGEQAKWRLIAQACIDANNP